MNARDLVIYFSKQFEKRYGAPYPVAWSKHVPQMKRLLGMYSAEQLNQYIDLYFAADNQDAFATTTGHSLGYFVTAIPKLISSARRSEHSKPVTNNDYDRIERARKAALNGEEP